eukprot:1273-Heterococcus_DN1.PRE.1
MYYLLAVPAASAALAIPVSRARARAVPPLATAFVITINKTSSSSGLMLAVAAALRLCFDISRSLLRALVHLESHLTDLQRATEQRLRRSDVETT